jgi:hypothetical protein
MQRTGQTRRPRAHDQNIGIEPLSLAGHRFILTYSIGRARRANAQIRKR